MTSMNTPDILQILNDEKAWLQDQPGMQPWDEGCRVVAALLEECLGRYSQQVREPASEESDTDRLVYLTRLWRCLGYHWRDAVEFSSASDGRADVSQVAQQIAAGQGYRRGRRLGGDPLRDVVLAVAMVRKDQRAPRAFEEDYYTFACALAAKVHHRLAADPDPWWSELLDHLAGYTRPTAKLEKFSGRCALQNWLGTVIWNFLRRRHRAAEEPASGSDGSDCAAPTAMPLESLEHFTEIVRLAVGKLDARERLLLALIHVDGLRNKDAATVLGIHPGNVTRALEKALSRLQAAILEVAADRLSKEACAGVFEDLRENPKLFAAKLREALQIGDKPS